MPIGFLVSFPIGLANGSSAIGAGLGPVFGIAFGTAIGLILEKKHAKSLRPLTKQEMRLKKISLLTLLGLLLLTILVLVFFLK
jgi:hypothetical protein